MMNQIRYVLNNQITVIMVLVIAELLNIFWSKWKFPSHSHCRGLILLYVSILEDRDSIKYEQITVDNQQPKTTKRPDYI